jgi:hypothetical protein
MTPCCAAGNCRWCEWHRQNRLHRSLRFFRGVAMAIEAVGSLRAEGVSPLALRPMRTTMEVTDLGPTDLDAFKRAYIERQAVRR